MQTNIAGFAAGALFAAPLAAAAISDLRSLRIPNWVSLGLIAGFFAYAWIVGGAVDPRAHFILAAVAFAAMFCLYVLGWFGGGDVKLMTAVVLWAGPPHAARFVLAVALAGGAIAILLVLTERLLKARPKTGDYLPRQVKQWARRGVFPYSIPIVIAAISILPGIVGLAVSGAPAR
ncbi:MAG: prepilin peptidase [Rhodomicrobium sp.]